jgi:hypothetical protein
MMMFSSMLNMTDISGPLDFSLIGNPSSFPQNTASSLMTFFDSLLMSPANILLGGMTTPGTATGLQGHESSAYIQLWCLYQ